MISIKQKNKTRGQAQTEYLVVVALTFFGSLVAVDGIDVQNTVVRPDQGDSDVAQLSVMSEVTNTRVQGTPTIPGLKDALYIYQDKLFRWISDQKPHGFHSDYNEVL